MKSLEGSEKISHSLSRGLLICLLCVFHLSSSHGLLKALGLNIDLLKEKNPECNTTSIDCPCGVASSTTASIEIPQCTRFHRFKMKCGPCDGMTSDKICPIFQNCLQCNSDGGGKCSKCPRNKFGDHCDNDCQCKNGAECDIQGRCLCPPGFEGQLCDRRSGCNAPNSIKQPLIADFRPPENPTTILYSCPPEYELEGSAVSSCLPDKQWSSPPPSCLIKCPTLSEPAQGHLRYSGNRLVEGVTAEATCYHSYRLIGEPLLTCQPNGTWNYDLPKCEELATCPDTVDIPYTRQSLSDNTVIIGGYLLQDSEIEFTCEPGFHLLGADKILCLFDGTWSHDLPTCVKVSPIILSCQTTGSEVMAGPGVPVRIFCPPECAGKDASIWGTSIYRSSSNVCASAIHSGKLTNTGGLVAVINNAQYTNFAGSNLNRVQTQNYEGRDESFRFDKIQSLVGRNEGSDKCADILEKLENVCVYVSSYAAPRSEAEATCINLGLRFHLPKSEGDIKYLKTILPSKGISKIWNGITTEISDKNSSDTQCEAITIQNFEFIDGVEDCERLLHYVCTHNPDSSLLASCDEPRAIENGDAKPMGKVDGSFYVGSSIQYSCKPLHYLKGNSAIYCRGNGTWSKEVPTCVRVDTCEEPPAPIGGLVNFLPPVNAQTARISLIPPGMAGHRRGRLPHGLDGGPPPEMTTPTEKPEEQPDITLPAGWHKVGTRAAYECESRYYQLVGSRTRRCEGEGRWSGRPPTCIPICGRSDSARSPFIVNGNASDIGQWPWQAGIARYISGMDLWYLLCGGSLLTERWVLTAAHCVTYGGTTITFDPDKFRVYLGKYHRSDSKDDDYVQTKTVSEIHIHPDYEPQIYDADIALLLLDTPVQLNTRVQPVCLPTQQSSQEHLTPGSKGVVTGWGMNENQTNAETLQQAVVPVVSREECEKGYMESDLPLTVTENMFCAGFKEGKIDACSGDSGGPVVFLDRSSKERRWEIQGIVSWGSPNGCGHADQYGGYTKVSNFLDWVHLYF